MGAGMDVIYMAHPVSGDVEGNLAKAKQWIRAIEEKCPHVAIVASWITECEIWDDNNPEHRAAGLRRDLAVIERCHELWLVGDRVSPGMAAEADHAARHSIPVVRVLRDEKDWTWIEVAGRSAMAGCNAITAKGLPCRSRGARQVLVDASEDGMGFVVNRLCSEHVAALVRSGVNVRGFDRPTSTPRRWGFPLVRSGDS